MAVFKHPILFIVMLSKNMFLDERTNNSLLLIVAYDKNNNASPVLIFKMCFNSCVPFLASKANHVLKQFSFILQQ